MARRNRRQQSKHDEQVRRVADRLSRQGWTVEADIAGYPQPSAIGGRNPRIPDIVARKKGAARIIEVETPETVDADRSQHATFRRSAGQRFRTTFRLVVAD